MPNFYLDIETTGTNPKRDKIITIQFAELERNTAHQKGGLRILKEWESNERTILQTFISESGIIDSYPFAFVPVGYNLSFEHKFLLQKSQVYGLLPISVLNRPYIDLRALSIVMNRGEFRGSGLDKITGKPHSGEAILNWYQAGEWSKIEKYIEIEAMEFISLCSWLFRELPPLLTKFKTERGLN